MRELKSKILFVCVFALLVGAAALGGDYIDPGQDSWTCTGAEVQFGGGGGGCLPPIPADFFGPGSDPFTGTVHFKGHEPPDTVVERHTQAHVPPPYPSNDLIDTEIVALSLKSVNPITVTYNGGQDPEDWDVEVGLSVTPVPITDMNAIKEHANGGVFTADFYVQPIFIFTKVVDPIQQRTLDTGMEGIGPLLFSTVNPYPWQHSAYGKDFKPSGPNPMELDTGDGCHISLVPVKPPVPHLKWSQPPIEWDPMSETPRYCGWDELSWEERNPIWYDCWNCQTQCHGDADCDGYVGLDDLTILQMAWPPNPYDECADFDHDGTVGLGDLAILEFYWNTYPPADCPGRRTFWHLAADDFRCLGSIPITSIHWWGSHPGWEEPGSMPPEDLPIAWRIGFWSNVPAGFDVEYSHPEELLWQIEVPEDRVEVKETGTDAYPEYYPNDVCYQYYVELEPNEVFWQNHYKTMDDTYWLSIMAIYDPCEEDPQYPWGWKTRPWSWMDDAVRFWMDEEPEPGIVLDPERNMIEPIEEPIFGESFDLAFELDTDPNYIKHEQPFTGIRDWPHYEDELSMAIDDEMGVEPNIIRLVADDWPCDTNYPVTAAVWWGSYIGYRYAACDIVGPWMALPVKPKYFWLTVWDDVPAGVDLPYSHPNDIIWEYKAYDYDEVLVGYDKHPIGAPNEPVFRYSVRLPEEDWFCQEEPNEVYWFSVVAVYDENTANYDWGWTNHRHVYNDDAVSGVLFINDGPEWLWEELYDQNGDSEDMSFVLFTHPNPYYNCPDYNNDGIVNFIDYAYFADDWRWSGPLGGYNNSDLNCDGLVDLYDLAIFVRHWLESCQPPCRLRDI